MSASESESTTLELPEVDLGPLLALAPGSPPSAELLATARAATDALHRFGVLIVRDPRASAAANDKFLDLLELYFAQPDEVKDADVRKDVYYQVGRTPENVERPRDHCTLARSLGGGARDRPQSLCPPEKDRKERFMWRVGAPPAAGAGAFPQLHAEPVVPAALPQWAATMDSWGSALLAAAEAVAELAALGAGLPRDAFSARMRGGAHLLAPTASDLSKWGEGVVLAGYHYDLNFLTVHGRARFPGLYVWTREGRRLGVAVPPGCLLVQAGKQLEHLTGGHVRAGMHEVVVSPAAAAAAAAAHAAGRSRWRISSTLFSHIASDVALEPLGAFGTPQACADYPRILCGDHVNAELAAINLGSGSDGAA
jgi:isopenicillin N synthase-like dioxygenase